MIKRFFPWERCGPLWNSVFAIESLNICCKDINNQMVASIEVFLTLEGHERFQWQYYASDAFAFSVSGIENDIKLAYQKVNDLMQKDGWIELDSKYRIIS
jgi:hypothetical protein